MSSARARVWHCHADALNFPRADIRVLVPGAGLARLAWEIVRRGELDLLAGERAELTSHPDLGFSCQANEFSLYMVSRSALLRLKPPKLTAHCRPQLIASSLILNK